MGAISNPPIGDIARLEWESSFLRKQEIGREWLKYLDIMGRNFDPIVLMEGALGYIPVLF